MVRMSKEKTKSANRQKAVKIQSRARVASSLRNRKLWYDEGYFHGKQEGKQEVLDKATEDLDLQRRKANIELAQSLSQMVEATARAVVTFIREAGIHG
jgi:flagellar biosynthesis/type III secretory pathway protein FliH